MKDNNLIHGIEKTVISWLTPLAGGIITAQDDARVQEQLDFIKEVLVNVKVQLERLEKRVDENYTASREYNNFLFNTVRKAVNDLRRDKIKLFSNIIVNSTLKENTGKDYNRKYLFLDTIDKIDEHLFSFLCMLKSRSVTKGKEIGVGWQGNEPELKAMGIIDEFRFNADFLLSLGVMIRISQRRYIEETKGIRITDEYYVTEYGAEFVDFVSEQGLNQFSQGEEVK